MTAFVEAQLAKNMAALGGLVVSSATPAETQQAAAAKKAQQWANVLALMNSGSSTTQPLLLIGSRQPIKDVPVWATPQVLAGGFASGVLLAAFHENDDDTDNVSKLSGEGAAELMELLITGRYRCRVPEHCAIPVVLWLLREGRRDEAQAVIDEIEPFFDRLQFFPNPTWWFRPLNSVAASPFASVGNLRQVFEALASAVSSRADLNNKRSLIATRSSNALQHWLPLKWALYELFMDSVEETPSGGAPWPLQRIDPRWLTRAAQLLSSYVDILTMPSSAALMRNKQLLRTGGSLDVMLTCLRACVRDQATTGLTGKQVGRLRHVLAGLSVKRGLKVSSRQTRPPRAKAFAVVLAAMKERLKSYGDLESYADNDDLNRGLLDVEPLLAPVVDDGVTYQLAQTLPRVYRAIKRAQLFTVPQLIQQELVTSTEQLAIAIKPQVAMAMGMGQHTNDALARRLANDLRLAFYNRRSLLLLNLERQVQLMELPWAKPLFRSTSDKDDKMSMSVAPQTFLGEVTATAINFCPQTPLPNKLLQLMRELASESGQGKSATLLIDELAPDIFVGEFSGKFLEVARIAATLLRGTLYAAYYGLDEKFTSILSPEFTVEHFKAMCVDMSGVDGSKNGDSHSSNDKTDGVVESTADKPETKIEDHADDNNNIAGLPFGRRMPAQNGCIIECQQILTTQNLAVVYGAPFGLAQRGVDWAALVHKTWNWILHAVHRGERVKQWRARLNLGKKVAYAWRQLIFYLSVVPNSATRDEIIAAMEERMVAAAGERTALKLRSEAREHLEAVFLAPLKASISGQTATPLLAWVVDGPCRALRPLDVKS